MGKLGAIYTITNLINGNVYVGQSINDGKARIRNHRYRLNNNNHANPYLQNAFNKYGVDNFEFKVIHRLPIVELNSMEIKLIDNYRRKNKCYNIANGGYGRHSVSEESKTKMSVTHKLKHKYDKEYRKKYLACRAKKIICLNNMEVFDSIADASKALNVSRAGIEQVVAGKNSYVKEDNDTLYQFEYYEEGKIYSFEEAKENIRIKTRSVVCVNTGEVFEDVGKASDKYKLSRHSILRCCNKNRNFYGRLENGDWIVWRFLEEYDPNENISFDRSGKNHHRSKPIFCTTTNEYFHSSLEACRKYNLHSGNLTQTLKGKRKYCGKTKHGEPLKWKYA